MIKPIAFTHDIDRSYLTNTKKSRRSIKRTKTQNNYEFHFNDSASKFNISENKDDRQELIRKKINSSDEQFQIKMQKAMNDKTDTEGLIKIAELHAMSRKLKKSNQKLAVSKSKEQLKVKSLKSTSKDNLHRFKPTPPKQKILPGMKRRPLPSRNKTIQVDKDISKEPKSFHRFRPRILDHSKERISNQKEFEKKNLF